MLKTLQTTTMTPKAAQAANTLKSMRDLIESAMADGSYDSIPDFLIGAARTNPHLDWNTTLSHVLTWRSIQVGNRTYSTCLVGIPMFGQLGRAFAPIGTVQRVIKEAVQKSILAKEDGLVLLDSPIPRSTVQLLDVEDLYSLSTRLFERGVRGSPERVLEARLLESEIENVEEAIMVGLLYWRSDRPVPKILADTEAQKSLAAIVRQHVFFDRATPFRPRPFVEELPLTTFFDATRASSAQIVRRHLDRLIGQSRSQPVGAEIRVMMSDEIVGTYRMEVHLHEEKGSADHVLRLKLDTLRDGDIGKSIQLLMEHLAFHGITTVRTHYLTEVFSDENEELEDTAYATTTLH